MELGLWQGFGVVAGRGLGLGLWGELLVAAAGSEIRFVTGG